VRLSGTFASVKIVTGVRAAFHGQPKLVIIVETIVFASQVHPGSSQPPVPG
jgi:hypothetical protein